MALHSYYHEVPCQYSQAATFADFVSSGQTISHCWRFFYFADPVNLALLYFSCNQSLDLLTSPAFWLNSFHQYQSSAF